MPLFSSLPIELTPTTELDVPPRAIFRAIFFEFFDIRAPLLICLIIRLHFQPLAIFYSLFSDFASFILFSPPDAAMPPPPSALHISFIDYTDIIIAIFSPARSPWLSPFSAVCFPYFTIFRSSYLCFAMLFRFAFLLPSFRVYRCVSARRRHYFILSFILLFTPFRFVSFPFSPLFSSLFSFLSFLIFIDAALLSHYFAIYFRFLFAACRHYCDVSPIFRRYLFYAAVCRRHLFAFFFMMMLPFFFSPLLLFGFAAAAAAITRPFLSSV